MGKLISLFILAIGLFTSNVRAEDKVNPTNTQVAIFAMGCFWCAESEFRDHDSGEPLPGIISLRVGYAGGVTPNPTYESHEGYREVVKIEFDPAIMPYKKLLAIFWHNVDPLDPAGQFCDKGEPYKSAIYYSPEQKDDVLASQQDAQQTFIEKIATDLIPATTFYDAEDYHQNYKSKNPYRYRFYRWNCGRDQRLKEVWGE